MARSSRLRSTAFVACLVILVASHSSNFAQQTSTNSATAAPAGLPAYDKNVVAYVNGQPITRQELADDLIARKGREHIQLMINRYIIEQAAKSAGITVTDTEVDVEVSQLVKFANLSSVKEFENKVLKSPKYRTTLLEYRQDVIKQSLYMRKLVGQRLAITEDEIRQLYDATYGEKVKCRMIVASDKKSALELHTKIRHEATTSNEKEPQKALYDVFLHYARQQVDGQLAAVAGDIQPIGHFTLSNDVEKRAFELRDGEMSEVLDISQGTTKASVILLRETMIPANMTKPYEQARDALRQDLLDRKMRTEVPKLFRQLRDNAVVRDYLNNEMDIKDVLELVPAKTSDSQKK